MCIKSFEESSENLLRIGLCVQSIPSYLFMRSCLSCTRTPVHLALKIRTPLIHLAELELVTGDSLCVYMPEV